MSRLGRVALTALVSLAPIAALAQGIVRTTPTAYSDAQAVAAVAPQLSALQASIPSPCTVAPAADTYGGSLGTGTPCIHRQDATRPTQVQPANAVTSTTGTFSGTWKTAFAASPTTVIAQANTLSNPYICQATGTTAGFSGQCWQVVSTTLGGSITAITNTVISPVQSPAAGVPVSVVGRQ